MMCAQCACGCLVPVPVLAGGNCFFEGGPIRASRFTGAGDFRAVVSCEREQLNTTVTSRATYGPRRVYMELVLSIKVPLPRTKS